MHRQRNIKKDRILVAWELCRVTHSSYIPPVGALMTHWEIKPYVAIGGKKIKKGKKRINSPTQYANEHQPVGCYK